MQEQVTGVPLQAGPGDFAAAVLTVAQAPMILATCWWTLWFDMLLPPQHRHRHHRPDHEQLAVGQRLDHHLFA